MIAALYVLEDGPYADLDGVDCWGVSRDARTYAGPWPVVAHPPCKRWGSFANGGPSWREDLRPRPKVGDDGGCFASALRAVRTYGGVLEHPANSKAWSHFGLAKPRRGGGWYAADLEGGWSCCVEQRHYGHRARKPTWLYARTCGARLPSLIWGEAPWSPVTIGGPGPHSKEERARAGAAGRKQMLRAPDGTWHRAVYLSPRERAATPHAFRDLLISIARSAETNPYLAGVAPARAAWATEDV